MNAKELTALRWERVVLVLVILLSGSLFSVSQAEATLTAQSIGGTVEVLLAGEQDWKPLTATMKLKTGDQVKTRQNSSVDLWFEDGSVLNLAEETQMTISQLEISTAQKSRIARFKLWWGAVTAKVTKLAFTENVCEVETETVVAGVKFSEMTVIQPQNTSQSEVIARQGLIEIRQIGEGTVNISASLSPDGILFSTDSIGSWILVGVHKVLRKITLESNVPVPHIRGLLDGATTLLKIDNNSDAPIDLESEGIIATLGLKSSATFGISPERQELVVRVDIPKPKISFSFKRRTGAILCDGVYMFLNGGNGKLNGQDMKAGEFNCSAPGGLQRTGRGGIQLQEEDTKVFKEEQPVEPDDTKSETARGADPATPTPIPTPTPTVEEEDDEEEPTPTPTPTATPKDKPRPRQGPPPPPTETPASPSVMP